MDFEIQKSWAHNDEARVSVLEELTFLFALLPGVAAEGKFLISMSLHLGSKRAGEICQCVLSPRKVKVKELV